MPRVIQDGLFPSTDRNQTHVSVVFDIIQRLGNVDTLMMWHVFNMGVGFAIVVSRPVLTELMETC